MALLQRLPGLRLGRLHPADQVGGEQGAGAVVGLGVARGVEPAAGTQHRADLRLEAGFLVQAVHGYGLSRSVLRCGCNAALNRFIALTSPD